MIAGVDLSGRITGAKVVFHQESMIVHDTVRQRQLDTLLAREAGRPLRGGTGKCRQTTSTVQRSARAPCAPPSSLPRGWFCARTPHVQPRGPPRRRLTPL